MGAAVQRSVSARVTRRWLSALALGALVAFAGSAAAQPRAAEGAVTLSIDARQTGPAISRDIFGQFAEHLGTGIYGGV